MAFRLCWVLNIEDSSTDRLNGIEALRKPPQLSAIMQPIIHRTNGRAYSSSVAQCSCKTLTRLFFRSLITLSFLGSKDEFIRIFVLCFSYRENRPLVRMFCETLSSLELAGRKRHVFLHFCPSATSKRSLLARMVPEDLFLPQNTFEGRTCGSGPLPLFTSYHSHE